MHVIFGLTIAEWGTVVIIASTIIGFLNNVLKTNVKIPLDEVRKELKDIREQESTKHEKIDEDVRGLDSRVSNVEGRVQALEGQKGVH
ncbi:hypothetical protein S101189_00878 [Pediococcus acidilactici]|uniref:hypothetical protein n=1 Tax=Pediococcus acidilactici TaxID=1254 RepID=UPI0007EF527D|nr:hypothetical protein [Pediococcus acidilactici]ARW24314.1 hypothetical protein S100424_00878 [Pediococcus acidilactici]ARW26348.1 hypothetical protein S100313_00913 [Pediococcus acidilactici]ARW28432.1 hypothetical protein S101189_00878 [Pediococcus acidilactici]OBR26031.1 hypothetical protein SRCM100320_01822 [Pediococcus acidilactici]QHM53313.1 hypothetical protein C7M42_00004 [Pediococcus acidilactici]